MRLAVAATPTVALPTLDALLESEHVLVSVITQPDRPAGRGKVLTPTPVSDWAESNGVPCFKPESAKDIPALLAEIDCVITIGYGVLLPLNVLNIPPHGFLNLHFSILPAWRGAAPVQRAIEAGDSFSGVTVFKLDEGMDTGPIYNAKRFALDSDITSDELLGELAIVGVDSVLEALEQIESGFKPTPQPLQGASRARKLTKEEGRIEWSQPAEVIDRKIRAFTSNPGAWTTFRGNSLKISSPTHSEKKLAIGELSFEGSTLYVGTATTALSIGLVTPAGKPSMEAKSWVNGARLNSGDRFE